jgi:4-O-beta-D-mannosyl-D-glucose phosphorylase
MHVATSSIQQLLDYVINTPEDGFNSLASSTLVNKIAEDNIAYIKKQQQQQLQPK